MANLFTPPTTEVEREGPAGVRLPVLRYQLLVGLLAIGSLLAAVELGLCLLLCVPVLRGGELPRLWRSLGVDPFTLLSWLAGGSLLLFAITAALFLAWLQRARRNARALGMPARTPGALLWWFVPVMNLYRPYVVVRSVLLASRGGYGRSPGWLATWWLVWLASALWLSVELALVRGEEVVRYYLSDEVGVVLVLGLAAQGVLARPLLLAVVVAIQRAQREQRARGPSSTFAQVSLAVMACSLVACTQALPNDGATPSAGRVSPAAPVVAPVVAPMVAPVVLPEPSDPAPPAEIKSGHVVVGEGAAGLDEAAWIDWQESPLEADLDGDGVSEAIQWSCGQSPQTLRIEVGRAKTRVKYRVSELIGCAAALVTLIPEEATRQLVFTVDEHDEVGPDLHFIYTYRRSKLERIWSGAANLDFLVDGTWVTETSDCDDAAGFITTTTSRHRWNGAKVASVVQKERTPVEPGGCADP